MDNCLNIISINLFEVDFTLKLKKVKGCLINR